MIEIYVGLTLMGLGYILNQNRNVKSNPIKQINNNELPSAKNVYDSEFVNTVKTIEGKLVKRKADATTGPPLHPGLPPRVVPRTVTSQLTGMSIPEDEFKHNNMTPFYRGKLKHVRLDNGGVSQQLEAFTGSQQYYQPKKEVESLFQPERNLGNVTGMKNNVDYIQSRVEAPKVRNNTLPFDQVRVGPALNRGYTADPTGGFQQFDARDYAIPRNTDEIRAANKPKVTFEGRVVDGQKGSLPGKVGKVEKNRVPTFFKNTPDRYFKTTGAVLKNKMNPEIEVKYTPRQDTIKPYAGNAFQASGEVQRGKVQAPSKEQFTSLGVTNATLTHMPNQKKDDYGKGSILIYDNERSVTSTKTYQGNIISLVKSLTAPIEDLIKVTRKEYMVEAPREYGNMQASIPSKQTVYDPNQTLRTTIKETTIQEADLINLKGSAKLMVYDPNQVTRTTVKETSLQESERLNFKGPSRLTTYDPNQVTRTTIKETLLHDAQPVNIKGDRRYGQAYDPNMPAKPTVRQTVEPVDTTRNFGGGRRAHTTHDPNDIARTTIKEMTDVDAPRDYGNPDRIENFQGGYQNENFDAPETQRHMLSKDSDYQGHPTRAAGDAYAVVEDTFVPRETQKESITDDSEYFGGAGDKSTHKQMSYDDAYNEVFDSLKEELLEGREPTQTSVKLASGAEDIVLQTRKIECDSSAPRAVNNRDHITNIPLDARSIAYTKERNDYEIDDRLDIDILEAFNKNEFTQRLDSVA